MGVSWNRKRDFGFPYPCKRQFQKSGNDKRYRQPEGLVVSNFSWFCMVKWCIGKGDGIRKFCYGWTIGVNGAKPWCRWYFGGFCTTLDTA
jgi:hypothetical protein